MDNLKTLQQLGQQVAQEQDAALSQVDLSPIKRRLLLDTSATVRRSPVRAWQRRTRMTTTVVATTAGAVALAAAALVFIFGSGPTEAPRLQVKVAGQPVEREALDNWWSAPSDALLPIEFSDGTKVGLQRSSRARVLQVDANGAHIVLESGASRIDVVRREASNWRVSAGPFLVQVVGTSFDLEWGPDDDLFVLKLHKGSVNLSGCLFGSGRSVVAGETVRASCKNRHYEIATRDTKPALKANAQAPAAPAGSTNIPEGITPVAPAPRAPSWRTLAHAGKYTEAIEAANSAGFADALASSNAEDLALLGDAARFSGRPGNAISAYEALRSRFPRTGRAATAAYSLARTHFDQRGAYSQAARWFQAYLTERPSGPLAREARGRLMESLNRSGDRQGARRMAEAYLKRYPSGPHAALAQTLAGKKR